MGDTMTNSLYRTIGGRIRRARENLGLSQQELAQRLDYSSAATISHFESGERKISIIDLQRIAQTLGMSLDYFLQQEHETQEVKRLRFRAQAVLPVGREAVVQFLSFARQHGGTALKVPPEVGQKKPWDAADFIREATGAEQIPVSPYDIAKRLDVPVFEWDFPDEVSGVLVCEDERYCIGVNESHPRVRQRFTVAHELGHLVMDRDHEPFFDYIQVEFVPHSDDEQEREMRANQFAANLLMPADRLRQDAKELGTDVQLLARRYGVSQNALWFRLVNLGIAQEEVTDATSTF